jgi:hypothetical protein
MKNFLSISILILSLSVISPFAKQAPHIIGQNCIGGSKEDNILFVIKLRDGNFLSCGTTDSQDGEFAGFPDHGGADAFLIKTDGGGNVIWKKTYGGTRDEVFYNVIEKTNGDLIALGTCGFDKIVIGGIGSNNLQPTGLHGRPGIDDVWLVKTNSNGDLVKQKCFGGSRSESRRKSLT